MSAAATAAGYLYATGRLRGGKQSAEQRRKQREAERAAEDLKREREAKEKPNGGGRP